MPMNHFSFLEKISEGLFIEGFNEGRADADCIDLSLRGVAASGLVASYGKASPAHCGGPPARSTRTHEDPSDQVSTSSGLCLSGQYSGAARTVVWPVAPTQKAKQAARRSGTSRHRVRRQAQVCGVCVAAALFTPPATAFTIATPSRWTSLTS
eukprot:scaffold327701_cov59-Tisochrysis_lutea.AAC.1